MGFKKSSATFVINIVEGYGVAAQRFFFHHKLKGSRVAAPRVAAQRVFYIKFVVQDGTQELLRSVFHLFRASRLAAQLFSKKKKTEIVIQE